MSIIKLKTHRVLKPWGRHDLAPLFADQPGDQEAVGEIWYEEGGGAAERDLLIKYLFTSEKLSIQVHPDDESAQARGFARGKDEAWVVLAAEDHSTIGLGLKKAVSHAALRAASLDGSIEQLLDWKPVKAGDVIYSPARTVHAIGAGLRVMEIQQNLDLTYRLYDYGRPRELHLDDGIVVADPRPFEGNPPPRVLSAGREVIAEGGKFVLERWTAAGDQWLAPGSVPLWVMPVRGAIDLDGQPFAIGEVAIVEDAARMTIAPDSLVYAAYPGADVIGDLIGGTEKQTG
ncbi:class I mannose-6-phosphate isomerase [Sphingomonas montanisoli]|uniref:Phosphoheptose isomerase n=1 Tax=Sphingomonas montanisoli TaxID=2606412 RepID=A0A5D9C833_9SPHN|nr:class I mannose-6-phosphate isomerase [Sphingomonas montanisoli]TZG27934.1 phosphoheptose isomerase [Sphingomonas montanisoli]